MNLSITASRTDSSGAGARSERAQLRNSSKIPRGEQRHLSPAQPSGVSVIRVSGIKGGNNVKQVFTVGSDGQLVVENVSGGHNAWQFFGPQESHRPFTRTGQAQNDRDKEEEPPTQLTDECASGVIRR